MKKEILILVSLLLFGFTIKLESYVPDKETAIKIAEAIWLPLYGAEDINRCKPFVAELQGDSVWHVHGTAPPSSKEVGPMGDTIYTIRSGGVPHILLNKSDARVLKVYHTK